MTIISSNNGTQNAIDWTQKRDSILILLSAEGKCLHCCFLMLPPARTLETIHYLFFSFFCGFISFISFILILPFSPLWISHLLLSWWTEMEQAHISLSLSHTLWVYTHLSYCAALVTSAAYEVCVFVCTYNMSTFGIWLNMCVWNLCVCSCMDTCTNLLLYVQTCDTECAFTYVYWVCLDYFEHGRIQASMRAAVGACARACVCITLYQLLCWNVPETIFPQVSRYHDKWARHHWDNHNTPQQYISITSHCLK